MRRMARRRTKLPPLVVALAAHSARLYEAKAALGKKKLGGAAVSPVLSRAVKRALAAKVAVTARRKARRAKR